MSYYRWLDVQPSAGCHYYRLLNTDKDGKTTYSTVVRVFIGKGIGSISIYPNPVESSTVNLQFTNQPAGAYRICLLNK